MTQSFAKTSCSLSVVCALTCAVMLFLRGNNNAGFWAVMSAAWCVLWLLATMRAAWAQAKLDSLPPPDKEANIQLHNTTGASKGGGRFPSDEQGRIIADNPTPAVREKLAWLDERDRLNTLARKLRDQ